MSATTLGNVNMVDSPDLIWEDDLTNGQTLTVFVQHSPAAEIYDRLPDLGNLAEDQSTFPGLILTKRSVRRLPGDVAKATLTYRPQSGQGGASASTYYETDEGVEEIGILQVKRYSNLSADDQKILSLMITNGLKKPDGKTYWEDDLSSDARAQECAAKIKKGVVTVKSPFVIFREVNPNSSLPNESSGVGQIATPPASAPTLPDNRNWLFVGDHAVRQNGTTTRTRTWQGSGPTGWDTDLY